MSKMFSIFTNLGFLTRISLEYKHEYFHQKFNRELCTSGGLLNGKIIDFVPCVGILIVKRMQKVLLIVTNLDIQVHNVSSALLNSLLLECSQSTAF